MAIHIDHGEQRFIPEDAKVTPYIGKSPLMGQTYLASRHDTLSQAAAKFAVSGMEYMLHCGEYFVPTARSAPKAAEPLRGVTAAVQSPIKSDGGPSTYYDFLSDWVTLNDAMEYLAENRWGKYALHLKDSMKACFRFGSKEGADVAYDAKKLVYSGLRLLVMIQGKAAVHSFLQKLIADPQFQPKR